LVSSTRSDQSCGSDAWCREAITTQQHDAKHQNEATHDAPEAYSLAENHHSKQRADHHRHLARWRHEEAER
jgi:hypothetical protein